MEVVAYILLALVFIWTYGTGYLVATHRFKNGLKKFDGRITVDGYELKELVLEIDIPDIAKKPYLIIEIKHEDKS